MRTASGQPTARAASRLRTRKHTTAAHLVAHTSNDLLGEVLGGKHQVNAELAPTPAQLGHLVGETALRTAQEPSPGH